MLNHLIMQDHENRRLALDPTQSFIIKAPAGSGKTELLIQRFLSLLARVKSPNEILAITFTKKAANEMRERIIRSLKEARDDVKPTHSHKQITYDLAVKVLQQDKKLNWSLIDNPNQLRIQTIDALCSYLTKQLPLLSRFGSQPSITDHASPLYHHAIQAAFSHVEENSEWREAISELFLHVDNDLNKLYHLLIHLLEKRDQWLPYIQLNINHHSLKNELEHHLALIVKNSLRKLRDVFPKEQIAEFLFIARFAANNLTLAKISSPILACANLTDLPPCTSDAKEKWLGLAHLLLTKSFSWRKSLTMNLGFPSLASIENSAEKNLHLTYRQKFQSLMEALSENETLRYALEELFFLPQPFYNQEQWKLLKSLLSALKVLVAELRLSFQQQGQIDFVENTQAAIFALGSEEHPTDLALALDYRLCHILVDEFQDTSHTQYHLLEKLTLGWQQLDGRTLFIVGDPMQSIYRFREAEVGLFIRMIKYGLGEIKLIPLTLAINFRSTQNLVDFNNYHFKKIFPKYDDIATGAVAYNESISNQNNRDTHSIVDLKGLLNADESTQALHIVSIIQGLKINYPKEKIAILVRSRNHLRAIIPALKQAKIPYRSIEIDPLAERQVIQDLISLTCALLHPFDRIAWLALLRAPWSGLTLGDLLALSFSDPHASILTLMQSDAVLKNISADGLSRLSRLLPILKSKVDERARYDLRTWVESTWLLLGGPASLYEYDEIEDVNEFFKLLETFNQSHDGVTLEKLKDKVSRLYASTMHDDSLQIMTIHSAKGLEFDTVILPHLEKKGASDDKSLLLWMEQALNDKQFALLLAPIPAIGHQDLIYEYINRQIKIKANFERDRLFYVATTRAKKNLHLFFNLEENDHKNFKIESGSFLEKIWPLIEKQKENIIHSAENTLAADSKDSKQSKDKLRYITRLASSWNNPIEDRLAVPISHQKPPGFQLRDHHLKTMGIVLHAILQKMSMMGLKWWQDQSKNNQITYIRKELIKMHLTDEQCESLIPPIFTQVQNVLDDERGRWILHPHQAAQSEFAVTAWINGKIENLIIDRTFIDENGTRFIIDYKTTDFSADDLETFLQNEENKYKEKMYKYYEAMKLLSNHPIRLALYFPALPAFREWEASE